MLEFPYFPPNQNHLQPPRQKESSSEIKATQNHSHPSSDQLSKALEELFVPHWDHNTSPIERSCLPGLAMVHGEAQQLRSELSSSATRFYTDAEWQDVAGRLTLMKETLLPYNEDAIVKGSIQYLTAAEEKIDGLLSFEEKLVDIESHPMVDDDALGTLLSRVKEDVHSLLGELKVSLATVTETLGEMENALEKVYGLLNGVSEGDQRDILTQVYEGLHQVYADSAKGEHKAIPALRKRLHPILQQLQESYKLVGASSMWHEVAVAQHPPLLAEAATQALGAACNLLAQHGSIGDLRSAKPVANAVSQPSYDSGFLANYDEALQLLSETLTRRGSASLEQALQRDSLVQGVERLKLKVSGRG